MYEIGMSDVKSVQMYVPIPVTKGRRSRKQMASVQQKKDVVVPTPTIPVSQAAGSLQTATASTATATASTATASTATASTATASTAHSSQKKPLIVSMNTTPKQKAGSPLPILSTTSVVGGKPKLSILSVPTNKHKASIPVPLPYNESPNTPAPVSAPSLKKVANEPTQLKIMPAKKTANVTHKAVEQKVHIQPMKRKNVTLKNNFTAKKITIHMENSSKVRKTRDSIRKKVANMTLPEITKKLREKGLIRETANPPENIQRLMMIDIFLFPSPM